MSPTMSVSMLHVVLSVSKVWDCRVDVLAIFIPHFKETAFHPLSWRRTAPLPAPRVLASSQSSERSNLCLDHTWYQGQRLLSFYGYTQHTCNYLRFLLQHLGSKHGRSLVCSLMSGTIGAVKHATISMPNGLPSNLKCGSLCASSAFISSIFFLHRSSFLSLSPLRLSPQINPCGASKPFIEKTLPVSPVLTQVDCTYVLLSPPLEFP